MLYHKKQQNLRLSLKTFLNIVLTKKHRILFKTANIIDKTYRIL